MKPLLLASLMLNVGLGVACLHLWQPLNLRAMEWLAWACMGLLLGGFGAMVWIVAHLVQHGLF